MKNKIVKLLRKSVLLLGLSFFAASCDEAFLEEVPKSFLSPENAYIDLAGFETAITALHSNARNFYENDWTYMFISGMMTDYATSYNNLYYSGLSSSDGICQSVWMKAYNLIKNANTIIGRAELDKVKWESESEKLQIVAEARFFRAWGYKFLANLFGGVPIVKEEVTSPKVDYVRNTRTEVYQFAKEDLVFAAANLPDTEKKPGRITKAAANHFLAEINICLGDWQGAIDAASQVIDNPNYKLMTERFGRRTNMKGDVYWDLFQIGNQNRSSGNKEAIWVIQIEYQTLGGGTDYYLEKTWGPRYYNIKAPDGVLGFVLTDELGRGGGWMTPTYYLQQIIWQDDWDDMRNSPYNIKREFYYNNPASKYYGQLATPEVLAKQDFFWCYPVYMKSTTPWDHPDGIINTGRTYHDIYAIRLAETYLLRAEAYLGKGDKGKAADDINVVRARANATPVNAADVDIDYILDERARELATEEFRTCTLRRLGLLYERTKKYCMLIYANGLVEPANSSLTVQPHHNLWPIPQTEIDLNGGAILEQNPGY